MKNINYPVTVHYSDYVELIATLKLCEQFISKAHHLDGCRKARENWEECNCGKDSLISKIGEVFEFNVLRDGDGDLLA